MSRLGASIGTKIILPYLLLTLIVAAVGAYVVTRLVTSTLQERFDNQLLDAGRVVSETMVEYERDRLEVTRVVAFTEGVAESLAAADAEALAAVVPQIAVNSGVTTVSLVDTRGIEVFGWRQSSASLDGETTSGADFSQQEDVRLVLEDVQDDEGAKRAFVLQDELGTILYTVGGVKLDEEVVGAVLVGSNVRRMVVDLTENAIARVTLYDRQGRVVETSLGLDPQSATAILQPPPGSYDTVLNLLGESTEQYEVVADSAENEVLLGEVEILNQTYQLAYGDWRLRNQSFGLFSVALPVNFIVSAVVTSRETFVIIFSLATVAVFAIGYFIATRITHPLHRLVQTAIAITQGRLEQRTGIRRTDEIGTLASSFDIMTANLAERNRQLAEQAKELEAILHSIADAVIVFDSVDQVVTFNPAAQRILPRSLKARAGGSTGDGTAPVADELSLDDLVAMSPETGSQRFDIGGRVFSALAAPVETPEGSHAGKVVVLRDVTREAEVEELKDGFITSVSHELRTPLTSIKGFIDLLMVSAASKLGEQEQKFAQVVSDNTDKMMDHVNKLIDIAEIQNGTLKLRRQEEPFGRLVRETVSPWKERMAEKGVSLTLEVAEDNLWIEADTVRLAWAIENVLRNAHDYTPSGGRVEVSLFREKGEARIDIKDTGIGISKADQPYLFSRFFRIQNEFTFNIPGIGLDLFITRSIVEAHGGHVWAESEPGKGSTFSLALPLVVQPEVPIVE